MREDKGFSLIELIVIIGILSVLLGGTVVAVGAVSGYKAKDCATAMEAVINRSRIDTMGKNAVKLKFYQGTDDDYYVDVIVTGAKNGESRTTERIGKKSVTVQYSDAADMSSAKTLQKGVNYFYIQFDRSSGALKMPDVAPGETAERTRTIAVSQGSRTYTIKIYPETGKVVLE